MRILICVLATAVAAGLFAGFASSQEDSKKPAVDQAAMMKKFMQYTTPDENHKQLAAYLGKWTLTTKMWDYGGDGKVTSKGTGTAEYRWVIPGLFMGLELKGTLMGMPYHGFTIMGWDKFKKAYVSCSVNNMGTSIEYASGPKVDPAGKVMATYGSLNEWMTGEIDKPYKVITRLIDKDNHTVEIWDLGIGEAGKRVLSFDLSR